MTKEEKIIKLLLELAELAKSKYGEFSQDFIGYKVGDIRRWGLRCTTLAYRTKAN